MHKLKLIENLKYQSFFYAKDYKIIIVGSISYENKGGFTLNIVNKKTKEKAKLTHPFFGETGIENWKRTRHFASFRIPEEGEYEITVKGVNYLSLPKFVPFPFSLILNYFDFYSPEIDKEKVHLKITFV